MPIRRGPNSGGGGPNLANPEGSQLAGVIFLPIRKGPTSVGSKFGGLLFLPTRRSPIYVNLEGSNSEESYFCQPGGVLFMSIRRDPNSEGSYFVKKKNYERGRRDPKTYVDESKTHSEKY